MLYDDNFTFCNRVTDTTIHFESLERFANSKDSGAYNVTDRKEVKLNAMVDANFAIDYRYNKHVSAFLNINNFANYQYQRWLNYNVYGFNVLGGMTFTF